MGGVRRDQEPEEIWAGPGLGVNWRSKNGVRKIYLQSSVSEVSP